MTFYIAWSTVGDGVCTKPHWGEFIDAMTSRSGFFLELSVLKGKVTLCRPGLITT